MLPSEYLEKGWTQVAVAIDSNGDFVSPRSQFAVSWCMVGALLAALDRNDYTDIKAKIRKIVGCDYIEDYNDDPDRTHDEVIAVMKQAEQEMEWNNVA